MPVRTVRIHSGRTTHLLLSPQAQRRGRAIAGAVVVAIVVLAFVLDALERRQAVQEVQPQVVYRTLYIVATPTAQPPVPTAVPAPTAAPQVIVETVEVPIVVEVPVPAVVVQSAPESVTSIHERPHDETR